MKLTAQDLQIGDWVLYNGEPEMIAEVSEIIQGEADVCFAVTNYMANIDEIAPIPITPEILEKNGFYYGYTSNEEDLASNTIAQLSEDDKGWCWDEGGGAIKVIFPNETDGGMLVIDDQSFDRHLEFVYITTIYVHELQQGMRLCGIKGKEIKL